MATADILNYDVTSSSLLDRDGATTKPMKSQLINAESERRSSVEPLPLTSVTPATKPLVQTDRFWASVDNKIFDSR